MVSGSAINDVWSIPPYNLSYQYCDAMVFTRKTGNAVGVYTIHDGGSEIVDLTVGKKTFPIDDRSGINVTVTEADNKYVTGNFAFYLINGSNKILATGNFKLHNY